MYMQLSPYSQTEQSVCWKLFIRCINARAYLDTLADALLYAFLAALSKSALEKLRWDSSFDRIVVGDERSPRADQMNRDATNTLLLSLLLLGPLAMALLQYWVL